MGGRWLLASYLLTACGGTALAPAKPPRSATPQLATARPPVAPAPAAPAAPTPAPSAAPEPSVPGAAASAGSEPDAKPEPGPGAESAPEPTRTPVESGNKPPTLVFTAETPHKLYERPRPEGKVAAAGHDERLARWNQGGTGDPSFVSNRSGYHPGARVVVDTKILNAKLPEYVPRSKRQSVLSQWRVTTITRKYGYWPFRICFEDGLRKDQALKGRTLIRMSIGRDRRIHGARLLETDFKNAPEVAKCLVARANDHRKLVYDPAPPRRLDVELSIKLWPGDARVPSLGPPDDTWENPGQLDRAAIDKNVAPALEHIRKCYAKGLHDDPQLWGRLAIRVDLDENGRVLGVSEHDSRFPDRRVSRCVVSAIRRVSFGPARAGKLSFVLGFRFGELR